jgi:Cu-processing system ATP-binding protein
MIIANNITKRFGKLKALDNVSFSCNKGECIALIGPNGSGKTTLIKCILGMTVCDSGFITFNRENIRNTWKYRGEIGYMPQMAKFPDNMTIGQVFSMMMDIRGKLSLTKDESLIDCFELRPLFNKRMGNLSGGTRQKVSACLAFLFDPKVLILDEPTAGLDPVASEILKAKIIEKRSSGKLILITSHVLSELDEMISHVIYMQEGKIGFQKTIEMLKKDTGCEKLSGAIASVMIKNRK